MRALLVCLLLVAPAVAEPTLKTVAARKALRVGMVPGLPPFVTAGDEALALQKLLGGAAPLPKSKDGRALAGLDVELAFEVARALGVQLEVGLGRDIPDALDGLDDGRFDLVVSGVSATLERARTVAFSEPYFASGLVVLARDPRTTLESLRRGAKVVFSPHTTAESFARRELAGARLLPVPDLFAAVEGADALVVDYVAFRDARVRGRLPPAFAPIDGRRFTNEPFAFAARQGDPDFVAWLNLFIRQLRGSGTFHRLAARYNTWFRAER